MKKILFLIPTLDKGGAENVLINLVNNLNTHKYDITVQTLFDQNSQKAVLNKEIYYKSFLTKQFKGNSKLLSLFPAGLLYRLIVKDKYDIVISYLEGPTAHIVAGCPFSNSRKIAWIHVELSNERLFKTGFATLEKAVTAYKNYDRIVYVAKTVKTQFEKTANYLFPQGEVLYNTVASNTIISKSKEQVDDVVFYRDELNVVSVGRIIPMKGYDRLVRVHKRLIERGINHKVYIIGEGGQQADLESYIKENHLKDSFIFVGFRDNPYKYVANADLFVCSSRREGFSTAVTESLIIGTPVLSTNCSGAYELLGEKNEYGIVTDNSEEGIYQGMKKILTNKELLEHYKDKAIMRGKMFSIEKTVAAVEKMLDEL